MHRGPDCPNIDSTVFNDMTTDLRNELLILKLNLGSSLDIPLSAGGKPLDLFLSCV